MNETSSKKNIKTNLEIKEEELKNLRNEIDDLKDKYTQMGIAQIINTEKKERKRNRDV